MYRKFRFDRLDGINFGVGIGIWSTALIDREKTTRFPAFVVRGHFWKWHAVAEVQCGPAEVEQREPAAAQ